MMCYSLRKHYSYSSLNSDIVFVWKRIRFVFRTMPDESKFFAIPPPLILFQTFFILLLLFVDFSLFPEIPFVCLSFVIVAVVWLVIWFALSCCLLEVRSFLLNLIKGIILWLFYLFFKCSIDNWMKFVCGTGFRKQFFERYKRIVKKYWKFSEWSTT